MRRRALNDGVLAGGRDSTPRVPLSLLLACAAVVGLIVLEMWFSALPVHHPRVTQPHLPADAHITRPHVVQAMPTLQQRSLSSPARPPHMPVNVLPGGGDSLADAPKGGAGEPLRLGDLPIPTYKRLPKDPLQCRCGTVPCTTLERPTTSHLLHGFRSYEAVKAVMQRIAHQAGMQGPEVIVSGAHLPDHARLRQIAAEVFGDRSYRHEPLEVVSLVYTNADTPEWELLSAMMRLSAGASIAVHREDDAVANDDVAVPAPRQLALQSVQHPASLQPSAPHTSVSFAIQYFRRQSLVRQIGQMLNEYPIQCEVLIHNDSGSEHEEWAAALNSTRHYIVHSGNLHEVRGYNRLVRMASSDVVALLQDDDIPPREPQFVTQAWELFTSHPKLALIGGLTGQIQGGPGTGRFGKQRARHVRQIPYVDAAGRPFMFVSWVNMGPFLLKRSAFLRVGGFYEAFSCRGDPGIGFDYEFGIRLWKQGYQVGLTIQGFRYHAGSTRLGGTRSSTEMKSRRDMLESRNTAFIHLLYKGFYENQAPQGANKSPAALKLKWNTVCPAAQLPTVANRALMKAS